MKTVPQLKNEIADLKSRPPTDSIQAQIESLQRKLNQTLSADKKDVRKLRSRATFIVGSAVLQAAEQQDGQHILIWLRDRVRSLPAKDRDVLACAFPQIFSQGASAPAKPSTLPAEPAAHHKQEIRDE